MVRLLPDSRPRTILIASALEGAAMIVFLVLLLRAMLRPRIVEAARAQAERGVAGRGFAAISHFYVMDWVGVWSDIALGLLIAGVVAVWVPSDVWSALFLSQHPVWAKLVGPLIGLLMAVLSFVCSVGNVLLAAVLWNGGISF